MKRFLCLLIVVFIGSVCIVSCNKDDPNTPFSQNPTDDDPGTGSGNNSPYIAPAARSYVNSFINEMANRGIELRNVPLSVVFVSELTAANSGQFCAYGYPSFNGTGQARVEIIDSYNCWERWTDTEKENLIYHELGHALLFKDHNALFMPNGSAKSLMCSGICSNYRVYNKYQPEQRTYYLNELVSPSIPSPSWASEKFFSETLFEDNFDATTEGWETEIENDTNNESPYTFFIENQNVFSSPNSLGITATGTSNTQVIGYWYKYFNISNFDYCSNVVVRGDLITENLTDGYVYIVIDLIEYDTQNEPQRFGRHFNYIQDGTSGTVQYENFEATAVCVPQQTQAIKVLFFIQTTVEASVYLDNLEIELFE